MSVPVAGSADDPVIRRVAECVYVVTVCASNIFWSWIEDAIRRRR